MCDGSIWLYILSANKSNGPRVLKTDCKSGKLEEMGELAVQFGSMEELNGLIERLRGEK